MFTWTETPVVETWRQLRYSTSPQNVVRLLNGTTNSGRVVPWRPKEGLRERAQAIAACVRQAEECFGAAEGVGFATRPLLLFYGPSPWPRPAFSPHWKT